jgi:hypothetical protein
MGVPLRNQVEAWQRNELTDVTAKVVIYEAFVESRLRYEEFRSRTIWSLSNAFTSAFKELDPIPQFKARLPIGRGTSCGTFCRRPWRRKPESNQDRARIRIRVGRG